MNNLVIVESPAKAKTIEKFLGKDFHVTSSFGHIRDLVKKDFGIDMQNNYQPIYEITDDKKKVVTELKKLAKDASIVWLASDEDREGEAIAWHLSEVLNLHQDRTRRIVFHEITKDAIVHAVANPRQINLHLVDSQQARRDLDRLVGFELSPILWRKVKPALSAGRVQSVAVRLIVEREREIQNFESTSSYKVIGVFNIKDGKKKVTQLRAELSGKLKDKEAALEFLKKCINAQYTVSDVVMKPARKSPAAPFTTSTLQQEAGRKLGLSVAQTMRIAQNLYESGKITYMRTDSVNLSETAIQAAKSEIEKEFGSEYVHPRQYKTKTKGAQEAHEAIRPTYMNNHKIEGTAQEKRLYELIWKRTIASQMSDALLEKTTITIDISTIDKYRFVARGEVVKFDGFLKVYSESTDEENEESTGALLPQVKTGDVLDAFSIEASERFTLRPPRYTEASLVKKLEELGIGRPSTYAPTISTIQLRGYVVKEEREGVSRNYTVLTLKKSDIQEELKTEITGAEKNKLFPTDIGMVVNDFLMSHFMDIMDYNFTAVVEKDFDEIAEGKRVWQKMIDDFYQPFHKRVEETLEVSERKSGERVLGLDPASGKPVSVRIGRYGPMAQIGESQVDKKDPDVEKPRFARLRPDQRLETITLDEALELFRLPRTLGNFESHDVTVAIGRFGPYVKHNNSFFSLKKGVDDPYTVGLERAIQIIHEKREADRNKLIKEFKENEELKILNGRFGPYISYQKENYKIPKTAVPGELSYEECLKLIEEGSKTKKKKPPVTAKKPPVRKKKGE